MLSHQGHYQGPRDGVMRLTAKPSPVCCQDCEPKLIFRASADQQQRVQLMGSEVRWGSLSIDGLFAFSHLLDLERLTRGSPAGCCLPGQPGNMLLES